MKNYYSEVDFFLSYDSKDVKLFLQSYNKTTFTFDNYSNTRTFVEDVVNNSNKTAFIYNKDLTEGVLKVGCEFESLTKDDISGRFKLELSSKEFYLLNKQDIVALLKKYKISNIIKNIDM